MSDEQEQAVRSYSSKSKAKRGLQTFTKIDDEHIDAAATKLLFQYGDKAQWSFYEEDATNYFMDLQVQQDEPVASCDASPEQLVQEQAQADEQIESQPEPEPEEHHDNGVFSNMGATLQNHTHSAPAAQAQQQNRAARSAYKIEKNRPEQNGIKRPSAGGLCRQVWDAMDALREQQAGSIPTSQQVRQLATDKGWNLNNTMIEFYQWRKFNGITGRAPKAAAPVVTQEQQQPAPEQLEQSASQ